MIKLPIPPILSANIAGNNSKTGLFNIVGNP